MAMKKSTLFALLILATILLCSNSRTLHEYYISITSIDYNSQSKSLEITQQFITHDVEKAILKESKIDLNLAEPNEHPKADSLLFAYISYHLELSAKKNIELNWVGREVNLDESLWIYLQSEKIEKPESLTILNSCLTEVFKSQSNITHVNFGDKQQTQAFHQQKKTHTFKLK